MRGITRADLAKEIRSTIENLKAANQKWVARFQESPCDALNWGHNTFKDSASLLVQEVFLKLVEGPQDGEYIKKCILLRVVHGARWPENSTSPSANLINRCITQAWTELYEGTADLEIWNHDEG